MDRKELVMRVFGWGVVLMLFVISGLSAYTAVGLFGQRRVPARQTLDVFGRYPLAREARRWTASTTGAMELTACFAAGTAGLAFISAVMMAATSPQRPAGTPGLCSDCGRPIQAGTLCETCETS